MHTPYVLAVGWPQMSHGRRGVARGAARRALAARMQRLPYSVEHLDDLRHTPYLLTVGMPHRSQATDGTFWGYLYARIICTGSQCSVWITAPGASYRPPGLLIEHSSANDYQEARMRKGVLI